MMTANPPFADDHVAAAFAAFPMPARKNLLGLRTLIFETAAEMPEIGTLAESLRWGQPAYLTPETRLGSTIRLGVPKSGGFAIYAHCQTTVISEFRSLFPDGFRYEGNRAIHFANDQALPSDPLRLLIRSALAYHARHNGKAASS